MATLDLASPLSKAASALHEFVDWWTKALVAALPLSARAALHRTRRELYLDVRQDELMLAASTGGNEKVLLRIGRSDIRSIPAGNVRKSLTGLPPDRLVVRLAADQVFRRQVNLPLAAARNLRAIMANEIDRRTPFKADQVYFDTRVVSQNAERQELSVELIIAKRALVEQVLAAVARWDLQVRRITVLGSDAVDLLRGRRSRTRLSVPYVAAALVAVSVLLGTTSIVLAYRNLEAETASAAQQLEQAQVRGKHLEGLRREVAGLQGQAGSLAQKRHAVSALDALREITALLPDDVWTYQIQINGHEVRIAGFAPDASALIAKFEHSKLFENPKFRAPVTRGNGPNTERFDLSADLRANAKP